jgi:cell volume regulation protein A
MTIPMAEGEPGAGRLFDLVFVLVVVYTLLTAPTLPVAARLLGLAQPLDPRAFELEVAPLERIAADLLQITITPRSRLHGVEVGELRLPRGASVSMVIRDGESIPAEPRTVLRRGDDLLVVAPRALRERTERRLRQVSRHGRLAGWVS